MRNSNSYRDRYQAPGVGAPGLAAGGIDACLGSASGGVSGPGFGLSFGSTYPEKDCNLRQYSRTLQGLGHKAAATQMLCYNGEVADALAASGYACRVGPRRAQAVAGTVYKPARLTSSGRKTCKRYECSAAASTDPRAERGRAWPRYCVARLGPARPPRDRLSRVWNRQVMERKIFAAADPCSRSMPQRNSSPLELRR